MTREPNGNAILHIHTPPPTYLESIRKAAAPNQFVMIRQMLAGAQVLLMVEPAGTIVRTSSPWINGARVTLLQVDLDELVKDEAVVARIQAAKTDDELKEILKTAPGIKINFEPEIMGEFTPAAKLGP